jgi:type I restriction enzyme S subunit
VCEITAGQSPPSETYRKMPEGMPFFQGKADFGSRHPMPRTWCIAPKKIARPGDILISIRAPVGPTNIADVECCIGRGLASIRPGNETDRDFLLAALKFYEGTLEALGSGSTFQAIKRDDLEGLEIPLPPLQEQKRIAAILDGQMAAIERARAAAEDRIELFQNLIDAYLRQSLSKGDKNRFALNKCLTEVSRGVGATWGNYRIVGATRDGIAPAKENVGKNPERYKLVESGTIFYNPMRILLGSIAMIDDGEEPGITSPDYVVFKTKTGVLYPRWFYFWLRSCYGKAFINTLTRGAVRERMLFRRLVTAEIELPTWDFQVETASKLLKIRVARQTLTQQLETINKLPATLLRSAFSGNI